MDIPDLIPVRVWFSTDGNAAPRWEYGSLRQGKRPGSYVLEQKDGNKVFPLGARTVQVHDDEGEFLFGMDEHGVEYSTEAAMPS